MMEPSAYDRWYATPRGRWIGQSECRLLRRLLEPRGGESLLDVGCGTGYFTGCLAGGGLEVVGLDPDPGMLAVARARRPATAYVRGDALALPFGDGAFDCAAAVTSLCFVQQPASALAELWRVARRAVILGLLNRRSILHVQKHGRGAYRGARWDTPADVRRWAATLAPPPERVTLGTAIFFPGGGRSAQWGERLIPARVPLGGFLAALLHKPAPAAGRNRR